MPDTFYIKCVIQLLASIFGLTWANIRNRIVRQIGEKAMAAAEKGVEIFQVIASQGIGGLWQMLVDKLGDIKEMILEQAKDFVITKIITAGITWLISLLNPAAAFIKACKLIYDVVMFFVNNASRILKFVNTILDSVADIVRGNLSGVINKIDDVLGQMVPIIIGFLASVIGLGGIGEKIRQIVQSLQKPVNRALDSIIKTGLRLAGPIIRGIKGISGKVKAKVGAGKAWVKGKAETAKEWAKGKAAAVRDWFTLRKTFTAIDGPHALYWQGRGTQAKLTVGSTPTPVDAVLVTAARLINAAHPHYESLKAAQAQQINILTIKAKVEQPGPAGRQPTDVDDLNKAMEALAKLMTPLVPIVFPATAPPAPRTLPAWVQPFKLVKIVKYNRVAQVQAIDTSNPAVPLVQFQIINPRLRSTDPFHPPSGPTGAPSKVGPDTINAMWAEKEAKKARPYYMGPNPRMDETIGKAVEARMRTEGKIIGDQVRYARDAWGNPLPKGQAELYPISACAMGHIIDAVTWWNTNGRFTGPQSNEVQKFMTDPGNYEIEPSGPNSRRGSRLEQEYLPSAK
jgi:hypothetical protein